MKALILNSGLGSRLGDLVKNSHKSMLNISNNTSIISRQLSQLVKLGVRDVVITTGYNSEILEKYITSLDLPIEITFVNNKEYSTTNYIYSVYLAREFLDDDLLVLHGDIVCEDRILSAMVDRQDSCVVVSSSEKRF